MQSQILHQIKIHSQDQASSKIKIYTLILNWIKVQRKSSLKENSSLKLSSSVLATKGTKWTEWGMEKESFFTKMEECMMAIG